MSRLSLSRVPASATGRHGPDRSDPSRVTGHNGRGTAVYGSRVAPVTGRTARKTPGWTSAVSGGEYITVRSVRRVARDADIGVRNHPRTVSDVIAWHAFTEESARVARALVTTRCFPAEAARILPTIATRTLTVPVR